MRHTNDKVRYLHWHDSKKKGREREEGEVNLQVKVPVAKSDTSLIPRTYMVKSKGWLIFWSPHMCCVMYTHIHTQTQNNWGWAESLAISLMPVCFLWGKWRRWCSCAASFIIWIWGLCFSSGEPVIHLKDLIAYAHQRQKLPYTQEALFPICNPKQTASVVTFTGWGIWTGCIGGHRWAVVEK